MPWKESSVVEERFRFVEEWRRGERSLTELSQRYGVSRVTGYKWLERYREQGWEGLRELSRAPRASPQAMSEDQAEAILKLRREHARWGPRKLKRVLSGKRPLVRWPAASTIGELLKREGLVFRRRRRHPVSGSEPPLSHAQRPNAVWSADFKGWFAMGDGQRCNPLTISDNYSRYLFRCQAMKHGDRQAVQAVMEATFREYGLPEAMRTDNGSPFASHGIGGLSRLAVWWIRLGIRVERIEPGHPEQNGRHERMHRTLKEETADPPAANRRAQQARFDHFREEYNEVRPHEALGMATPARWYEPSLRRFPERLPEVEYAGGLAVRRVRQGGVLSWQGHNVFVGHALDGERIALEEIEEQCWQVYFGPLLLGSLHGQRRRVFPVRRPARKRKPSCGNDGPVGSGSNSTPVAPASPSPLEISPTPRDSHIPTAPTAAESLFELHPDGAKV